MSRNVTGAALALLLATWPLHAAQAAIVISEGWSRQTVPGVAVGVGYFVLKNTGTQRRELVKITSPLADSVQLHSSSVDAQGIARMWPVGRLELEPGEVAKFTPNGRHLMLVGLKGPLRVGTLVPVTLVFADEAPVTIKLEVRPLLDAGTEHAGHDHH